jgi:hypothetical protein
VRFTSGLSLLPFLSAFGMVATGSWLKTLAAKATVTTHPPTMWDLPVRARVYDRVWKGSSSCAHSDPIDPFCGCVRCERLDESEQTDRGQTFLAFSVDAASGPVIPIEEIKRRTAANPKTLPSYVFFEIEGVLR